MVPYAGYQAGFDAWNDERNRRINEGIAKKRRKNRPTGILADGTLVNADGDPIIASEGSFGGFTVDGQEHALQEMEDGMVRLSPEAMSVLDVEFGKHSSASPRERSASHLRSPKKNGGCKKPCTNRTKKAPATNNGIWKNWVGNANKNSFFACRLDEPSD